MIRLFATLLLCLCPILAFGAVPAELQEMQKRYAAMDSFSAQFQQELRHLESGSMEKREGSMVFKKPFLVRWETKPPYPELLVVGQNDIWNYLPDEELAYRFNLEMAQDSRSIITVLTGQAPLEKDFDVEHGSVSNEEDDTKGMLYFLLYPKESDIQMTEVQLWLNPKTSLIYRASVLDFYGNTNTVTFTSFEENTKPSAKDFEFSPPAGTEVEDKR